VRIRLLVIVGPTACGKTRLGVDVAHALGSEIVSADSRQVYRGLDIGSGKDRELYDSVSPPVPVHLIDIADPAGIYSIFHYQRDCYELLRAKAERDPHRNGLPLVMVGGSGLFVEAVLRGYRIPDVPEDLDLRRELMARPHHELLGELSRLDPELFERTDHSTRKRVARALEIALHARDHEVRYSPPPPVRIDAEVFGVEVPRVELLRRIDERLEGRLRGGMIEEVEGLLRAGVTPDRMAQLGLEYREITAFLTGAKGKTEMLEDLRLGIRRLAKRQRTWFRGMPGRGIPVRWIGPGDVAVALEHTAVTGGRPPRFPPRPPE